MFLTTTSSVNGLGIVHMKLLLEESFGARLIRSATCDGKKPGCTAEVHEGRSFPRFTLARNDKQKEIVLNVLQLSCDFFGSGICGNL